MSGSTAKIRILHVDDDPDFANLSATFLERQDSRFDVRLETGVDGALDRLGDTEFDCIVSDYDMPERNGIEFLERVREQYPDLPFILYTGKGSEEVASEAISAGASDYLQKETGTEQYELLGNRIKNSVAQYRTRQELQVQKQRLTRFHESTPTLLEAETPSEIVEVATRAAKDILDLPINAVYFEHSDKEELVPVSKTEEAREVFGDLPTFTPNEGIAWDVFETGEPRTYNDIRADSDRLNPDTKVRSELIYPLGEHGVLLSASTTAGAFDESRVSLAEMLAANTQVALDRADREQKLRETNRNYQAIFNDPNILVGLLDTDGTLLDINQTAMEYVDASQDDVIGRQFWKCPWFDHAESARDEVREWIDRAANGEYVEFEADRRRPDGEPYTVEGIFRPVTNDDGDVVSLLISSRNVTDRNDRIRRLEALNRATRQLLTGETEKDVAEMAIQVAQDILDLEMNAIHLYDEARSDLYPVATSEKVQELIGEPPTFSEDGSIAWKAFDQGDAMAVDDVHDDPDCLNTETAVHSELFLPLADHGILIAGSLTPAAFDQQDVLLGEILAGSIATALEHVGRTEQLRAREEELTRQNERLEEFASVVSHDLRNPLSVAAGRLEMARSTCDSDELDHVARAHDRMDRLIDDLLTLAKQGETVTDFAPVDVATVVADCWNAVETAPASLDIQVDRTIKADEGRLRQLFENLFRNAVEHGGEDITVTVGEIESGFFVEDTGSGIAEEDRETIFEAGYTTAEEGTGFGLSIVQEIVEAQDWDIRVTESADGGARFEISGVTFASA